MPRYAASQAEGQGPPDAASKVPTSNADPGSVGGGRRVGKGAGKGKARPWSRRPLDERATDESVKTHIEKLKEDSRGAGSFSTEWQGTPGHRVPYRFRIAPPPQRKADGPTGKTEGGEEAKGKGAGKGKQREEKPPEVYSDFAGLRFPTLETAENYDYFKDRGLERIVERAYPIKVPGHRRLDPYLREYIHFLNRVDPARFTIDRIAERYRLRRQTVAKVVQEWGTNLYLTRSGLTKLNKRQQTKESAMLAAKERQYAKWVGWDQLGDEDDPESDDEALGEFKGWRSTSDWIRKQAVEVESMHAFPLMEKRDPIPKRVDVDLVVDSKQNHKIINWIDPMDKVVF